MFVVQSDFLNLRFLLTSQPASLCSTENEVNIFLAIFIELLYTQSIGVANDLQYL